MDRYRFRMINQLPPNFPKSLILTGEINTAHCLGGCVMADSPSAGVVDSRHRVFGYKNMYICDGSVVSANPGVNPSLTIAAMTERAMSFIPPASATTWDDKAEPVSMRVP